MSRMGRSRSMLWTQSQSQYEWDKREKDIAIADDKKWSTHNGNKNILNLFLARTITESAW